MSNEAHDQEKAEAVFREIVALLEAAPEDQIASLAGTVDRQTVGDHWYNIADIPANNDLEWDYVVARSRNIPLRMVSVAYFLLSEQVPVPKGVIETLAELVAEGDR